jgi:hypothetical protein
MPTARPFAYNTGSTIPGTIQVGDLAVGTPTDGFTSNPVFWNGPDEELGYVIALPVPDNTQPTPVNRLYLSPTYKATDIALSNNNQTATQVFSYSQSVLGETPITTSDKVMFSIQFNSTNISVGGGGRFIGIGKIDMNYQGPFDGYPGNDSISYGFNDDGKFYSNGSVLVNDLPIWNNEGDIIDIAVNNVDNYWWIRVNGGYWNNSPTDNPTTNSGGIFINGGTFYPALCPYIYGSMTIQKVPLYNIPSGYIFLDNTLASIKFIGTKNQPNPFNDSTFIALTNKYFNQTFTGATEASSWLTTNGYWNSYSVSSPVLSLDAGNPLSYPGTGTVWTDLIGGKQFTLSTGFGGGPSYNGDNGGSIIFTPLNQDRAECPTSLPSMSTWTVGVWHYYTGEETGGAPCIVTETFIGGGINYSLGNNNGFFSAGFYNGGWQVTDGYSLSNTWLYIVGTYDGTTIKLYVNDTLVDSTTYVGTPTTSGAGIRLMQRWDSAEYWGGKLATVDIYDVALSQSEITSKWSATKTRFGY